MTDLRIEVAERRGTHRFRGSGFVLAGGSAITAHHVVRNCEPSDLSVVTPDGQRARVTGVTGEPGIDAALLDLAAGLTSTAFVGTATAAGSWVVTSRPSGNDPELGGTVTTASRDVVNAAGHSVSALQLHVRDELQNFEGYSGSAVRDAARPDRVLGMLVEQVHSRVNSPGAGRSATNVLYAVPLETILQTFGLPGTTARDDAGLLLLGEISALLDGGHTDTAERRLEKLPTAVRASAAHWFLRARTALVRHNHPVVLAFLDRALQTDERHAPSIAMRVHVLLLQNAGRNRAEAQQLAERAAGLDPRTDRWFGCLRDHGFFAADFVSATTLNAACPADWMHDMDPLGSTEVKHDG